MLLCEIGFLRGERSLKYLLIRHPDILSLSIGISMCTDKGLQDILNLAHIRLGCSEITGDYLREPHESDIRLHLVDLSLAAHSLTDSGLMKITEVQQVRNAGNILYVRQSPTPVSSTSSTLSVVVSES